MQQACKISDMFFSDLPYNVKRELAMYLDCRSDQNWKHLADSLNCPVYQIMAFEERALHTKEASPSLIFFDQFCNSITVEHFKQACYEIQNFFSANILDNYIKNALGSHDSLDGDNERHISVLPDRMHDFDNSSHGSRNSCQENNLKQVSLSRGICMNLLHFDTRHRFCKPQRNSNEVKQGTESIKLLSSTESCYCASAFITYFPCEKNAILNICKFLRKNKVNVSLDTDKPDVEGRPTEEWIKEKFTKADNIIFIASSKYKAFTKGKGKWWRPCFLSDSMKPNNDDNETGYHIPLIYSLMLDEHKRTKKEPKGTNCKRFLCLLLSESTKKDIPKWMRSYPSFIWPNHFKPFLHCILKLAA